MTDEVAERVDQQIADELREAELMLQRQREQVGPALRELEQASSAERKTWKDPDADPSERELEARKRSDVALKRSWAFMDASNALKKKIERLKSSAERDRRIAAAQQRKEARMASKATGAPVKTDFKAPKKKKGSAKPSRSPKRETPTRTAPRSSADPQKVKIAKLKKKAAGIRWRINHADEKKVPADRVAKYQKQLDEVTKEIEQAEKP